MLKDIIDTIELIKDTDAEDVFKSAKRSKFSSTSIARITSDLTLVFPVIVSRDLSIQTASMVAKAIERKAVVMLQMLFAAYQVTNVDNIEDVIALFHKNIKLKSSWTMNDIVSTMERLSESFDIKIDKKTLKAIHEDSIASMKCFFESDINPVSLGDYSVSRGATGKYSISIREDKTTVDNSAYDDINALKNVSSIGNNLRSVTSKQLLDTDIKKANELVPSTLVVTITYKPEGSDVAIPIKDVVVGVKARMVPIDSNDIINHILSKVEDKNWLLQFFRATTRETKFAKDFLFAIDKAKIDALANSKRGSASPMWKVLERRARGSKLRRFLGRANETSAITTIVLSQEEIDYVRKEKNVNFEDYGTIAPVMEAYNLMGFVICDESLEVAKFLFDTGEAIWENLSFTNLERENSNNDYRKIINLMTKVAR